MRLYEAIVENSKLDQLHKMLHKLFIDYDNSILKYKQTAFDNPSLDKDNMEDVQERVEQEEESKSALKNVITVLNKIFCSITIFMKSIIIYIKKSIF